MKMNRLIGVSATLLVSLGLALGGCSSQDGEKGVSQVETHPTPSARLVTVYEAKEEAVSQKQTFIGTITADAEGTVVPKAAGTLAKLYVKKGDAVTQGQVIGEVDRTQKELELREAETKLAEAKARLAQAKTVEAADGNAVSASALSAQSLENARVSYERVKKLVEAGALPRSQLDAAEADWIRAQSNDRAAQIADARDQAGITVSSAAVEGAQVAWEKAKKALSETQIQATMTGTVNNLFAAEGDVVSTQAAIAEIISLDHVVIAVQVAEDYLADFAQGGSVQISVPALGLETEGRVSFVGMTATGQSKLYPVEIRMSNPGHALRPGMRADVTVARKKAEKGIVVPSEAVLNEDGMNYVFLVRGERAFKQEVTVIDNTSTTSFVQIGTGIAPGDLVAVSGQADLNDNDLVTVENPPGRKGE
ncbi:efflux RND transporter periplasmic adaptor subunit [Brevibacillus ruminantium]|uniref:Efflux RND transporter periplasmic adaptor subunit n=1 Tax=Brevibacillus ruminantium TaxID=2950604 RepID=A0ABY4WNE0_9BACL|nr:efflux RND transporter periplasmic adaptor subunit [Brevibacillus ruminantium]USG66161.1 efflux RND transporter periplasmic adaptor subunit [Brevibacillus ruminantium]